MWCRAATVEERRDSVSTLDFVVTQQPERVRSRPKACSPAVARAGESPMPGSGRCPPNPTRRLFRASRCDAEGNVFVQIHPQRRGAVYDVFPAHAAGESGLSFIFFPDGLRVHFGQRLSRLDQSAMAVMNPAIVRRRQTELSPSGVSCETPEYSAWDMMARRGFRLGIAALLSGSRVPCSGWSSRLGYFS